jgi:pilus assembly protein CpaF
MSLSERLNPQARRRAPEPRPTPVQKPAARQAVHQPAPVQAAERPAPRVGPARSAAPRPPQKLRAAEVHPDSKLQELKFRVHRRLFDLLDLSKIGEVKKDRDAEEIVAATQRVLAEENVPLTKQERERVILEIQDEVFGLGPIEPLLRDPTVNDILVNRYDTIYIERAGKLVRTGASFLDDAHLMRIIERIVSAVGRRVDETSPMVDARLADGSRVNVIIPPLAIDGPSMSIRRFTVEKLDHDDLVRFGSLTPDCVAVLEAAVRARLNVLVSGGTGSGKTTLLNVLSGFIPEDERIVTIEDSAELQLKQAHVVRLETRTANIEGRGAIGQRDLVVNALRMRPDRIVVGEVRAGEALDMLQAMNTGHDGSITTVHANTPRDALSRIETMVAMTGLDLPKSAVRNQIAAAIDLVIQQARMRDGSRRVISVQEIVGMEGETISMQEIFTLERHGIDAEGRVLADLVPTGIRPRFVETLEAEGIALPENIFRSPAAARGGQA